MKEVFILFCSIFMMFLVQGVMAFEKENPLIFHNNTQLKIVNFDMRPEIIYYGYHQKKLRLHGLVFRQPITSALSGNIDLQNQPLYDLYPGQFRDRRVIVRHLRI